MTLRLFCALALCLTVSGVAEKNWGRALELEAEADNLWESPVRRIKLIPHSCGYAGDQTALGFWAFGSSLTPLGVSYTAVEFHGQVLVCCKTSLIDIIKEKWESVMSIFLPGTTEVIAAFLENKHPCSHIPTTTGAPTIEPPSTTTTTEAPERTTCPENFVWHSSSNSCFHFSTDSLTWWAASHACIVLGRDVTLARPMDLAQDAFIQGQLWTRGDDDWWFDLNDRTNEGEMSFNNGQKPEYERWAEGEPNNFLGWITEGEDCVMYRAEEGYGHQWKDTKCWETHRYICQVLL